MANLRKIQHTNKAKVANALVRLDQRIKCDRCNGFLNDQDQQVIKYQLKSYHVKCFKCAKCRGSMKGSKVYSDEEKHALYCEKCYLAMLDKCAACGKEICDEVVTLGPNVKLHRDCFKCDGCAQQLESYIEHEKARFCQDCYLQACLPKCGKCAQSLGLATDGQTIVQITFAGKYFHPECFLCDQCAGGLDPEPDPSQEVPKPLTTADNGTNSTEVQPSAPNINKTYFPVDGQKLCKNCALARLQR